MNDMTLAADALNIIAPLEQEGTKALVRTWLKAQGDKVTRQEPVVELETDKVVVEVCAPADGVLDIFLQESAEAIPGAVLGAVRQHTTAVPDPHPEHRLSPAVRRLLAKHQLDPDTIKGTGKGGRLTREDVMTHLRQAGPTSVGTGATCNSARADVTEPAPSLRTPTHRPGKHIPHSTLRRKIAEHMQASVATAPHVTSVFEADLTAVIAHQKLHKQRFADRGVNLTLTAYLVSACRESMAAAPSVNSRWHDDFLELFDDINIGIATALDDNGLIVPVLHQVQDLSLFGIAAQLQRLTMAARNGTLAPEQVRGGTFTISNHGTSGSLFATPIIINQPQSAILGVGAVERRVVVKQLDGVDLFLARPKAYVTLTIDHRVLDGSVANAWLRRFIEVLEGWPLQAN